MIDFIEYVVSELKSKRLSKANALSLIKQFSTQAHSGGKRDQLHPLIHKNNSNLEEQSYSSTFTGEEPFLADHRVNGQKVLPGVAYLEMVRAAVAEAISSITKDVVIEIKDVLWLKPIVVESAKEIFVALFANESDATEEQLHFEIYSVNDAKSEFTEEIVHCQGNVSLTDVLETTIFDYQLLKGKMLQGRLEMESVYAAYSAMGVEYGPAHRTVDEVFKGKYEILANLSLSHGFENESGSYVLHPGLLDGGLQSTIGLTQDLQKLPKKPMLPFALDSLKLFRPCTDKMFVWARYANDANRSGSQQKHVKIDLDFCDEKGNTCVQLRGFSSLQLTGGAIHSSKNKRNAGTEGASENGLYSLVPLWNPVMAKRISSEAPSQESKLLVIGGEGVQLKWVKETYPNTQTLHLSGKESIANIVASMDREDFDQLLWIAPDVLPERVREATKRKDAHGDRVHGDPIESQEVGVIGLFKIIKALLQLGYERKNIKWTFITQKTQQLKTKDEVLPSHSGVWGLVGSLAKEYPHWDLRLLDVDSFKHTTARDCLTLPWNKKGEGVALRNGEWFEQRLAKLILPSERSPIYKHKGVYVVIGGAGGLGEVWSQFMMEKYHARIVWIGRRPTNKSIESKIESLSQYGEAPLYLSADATRQGSLYQAYQQILKKYPRINGVVHSAIILQDQSLANMHESVFRASLSTKVDISVNMDAVFGDHDLDFMLFFSSLQSFTKSPGQANYAAGCTFKDSFAQSIQVKRKYPIKIMNWGYWGTVGIVADDTYNKRMEKFGIGSITKAQGMQILESLMSSEIQQLAALNLLDERFIRELGVEKEVTRHVSEYGFTLPKKTVSYPKLEDSKTIVELEKNQPGEDLNQLVGEILMASLKSIGLFSQGHFKLQDLKLQNSPEPYYEKWLKICIDYLITHKWLDKQIQPLIESRSLEELWLLWKEGKPSWTANLNLEAQIELLEACLRGLPNILIGTLPATEVMFPNSSMKLVEGIYKNNAQADYFNEILAVTFTETLQEKRRVENISKIRILEIGAGTGGTTAKLLPILQDADGIAEYCYTDLSHTFLLHAKDKYQPVFSALTTALFDVSKPLEGQSVLKDHYDIVIATNVLHATPNIRETLRNAKAALKKNGVLLLNELSRWGLFPHLTFGLLEGWWLQDDENIRIPGSPGLTREKWSRTLVEEGYSNVFFPVEKAHHLGQQIIAAVSDGVVQQPLRKETKDAEADKTTIKTPSTKSASSPSESESSLRDRGVLYFQNLIARTLRMAPHKVEPQLPFEDYGLDSISIIQFTEELKVVFPDVTSTLFFEVGSIDGLVDYFLENEKSGLVTITSKIGADRESEETKTSPPQIMVELPVTQTKKREPHRRKKSIFGNSKNNPVNQSIVDVAIIGISGRYPGALNLDEFWKNLSTGVNSISEIPSERWSWEDYYHKEKGRVGKIYTKWGGFISDVDKFDPLFFKISPVEAERIDPQERLFLESCYHTVEDAGYTPQSLSDDHKVGVFAGVMNSRYTPQPNYFSIANRVSYVFNFQGPSLAVDSACSSSLTAIHLALESIYSGLSSCALAGGVNVIVDPVHYLGLTEMTMLSSGSECKPFGKGADGFVDAEGVGTVLLKSLSKAKADGDHIYGVIKGSAVNAGGKTHGYTVPNPKAQAAVVSSALERAKLTAEHLTYIEAHGTGTALGDPIEISGLMRAFTDFPKAEKQCFIGSLKSNIGHCESAAGIAGLTKVLLQFKNQQIVPSLHSRDKNPEINFSKTPFEVPQSLISWKRPLLSQNGDVKEYPRTAGVSSFGAGGANAHVIVQEYSTMPHMTLAGTTLPQRTAIVLSARTEIQLRRKAVDLLDFLHGTSGNTQLSLTHPSELLNLGFTLQVGREAMDERLGFVVNSVTEMVGKLKSFLEKSESVDTFYRGTVHKNKETVSLFNKEEDLKRTIETWIEQNQLDKLLDVWVKGVHLEWPKLYSNNKPQRISLPGYPFARDRHWTNVSAHEQFSSGQKSNRSLHPFLHENISDLTQQCYRSQFTGNEFFFSDHQISQKGIAKEGFFPAVAFLEMARVAVDKAMPASLFTQGEKKILEIQNVVWIQPLKASSAVEVKIAIVAKGNSTQYEIYSEEKEDSILYSQGTTNHVEVSDRIPIDLAQLKLKLGKGKLEPSQIYSTFEKFGIHYGAGFQSIQAVFLGSEGALVELQVPASQSKSRQDYFLHPSILDGALQAALGLVIHLDHLPKQAPIPFALESLRVRAPFEETMVAWVQYSAGHVSAGNVSQGGVTKYDIDLMTKKGDVCVEMRGFSTRALSETLPHDENVNPKSITSMEATEVNESREQEVEKEFGLDVTKTQKYLLQELSNVLKLKPHEIDAKAPLENYGIESVLAMRLTNRLEDIFGSLSKTLFFEYQTIAQLADYFTITYPHIIQEKLGLEDTGSTGKKVSELANVNKGVIHGRMNKNRFLGGPQAMVPQQTKDVAIVGLAGRYPQADTVDEFWENLKIGKDCITEIPFERWDYNRYFHPERNQIGKMYTKWGGFISDVDKFDPLFFNISPKEAELIDPQERLFLETVWQTIEDAGYNKDGFSESRVGVYVGVMWGQYQLLGAEAMIHGDSYVSSSSYASIANRVSYFFNFQGPSMALDTMCSSSITAIHLACEAIHKGDIDVAVAGGVNVSIHPNKYLNLSQGNFAATDGKCRSFGEGGDGYVPGEGVGAVLLKPLHLALEEGDNIYAVIKSTHINHGGKTNGYTVPNPVAQANLISDSLKKANIAPESLSYIETHGTGTALGDPIEMTGLNRAFGSINGSGKEKQICPIGSVKSNIGHLESAAGIAALTKALLQIKHNQLVPSLHADPLNPNINFLDSPFYVQKELVDWPATDEKIRRIGISSFGAGGSNGHIVIEEVSQLKNAGQKIGHPTPEIFVLSARNTSSLLQYAEKVLGYLNRETNLSFTDLTYTSQVGRTPMNERLAIISSDLKELKGYLKSWVRYAQTQREGSQSSFSGEIKNVFSGNVRTQVSNLQSFIEGEPGAAYLRAVFAEKDLQKMIGLWIAGVTVDWSVLWERERRKRISFPTYPFARERYWMEVSGSNNQLSQVPRATPAKIPVFSGKDGVVEKLYFHPQWNENPINESASFIVESEPILLIASPQAFYSSFKQKVQVAHPKKTVISVHWGEKFLVADNSNYILDPTNEEHYSLLIESLSENNSLPKQIVHYTHDIPDYVDEKKIAEQLNHGIYCLFYLCRALIKQKSSTSLKLLSVHSCDEADSNALSKALAGFLKTLKLESPKFRTKTLALIKDTPSNEFLAGEAAQIVLEELQESEWKHTEVSYTSETETRRVKELKESIHDVQKREALPLKQKGVYVLTGGLGGIGFIFSRYLAENFAANLVLLGRSSLSPAHREKIKQLEKSGANILYLQADVSSYKEVKQALEKAKEKFSHINGIIHSAGIHKDAFILKKTKEEMEKVLKAKVQGTLNLDRATMKEPLDLFISFSSLAGVLGNIGQCDYAYGNSFLDAFTEKRESMRKKGSRRGKSISINWPYWEEGGMTLSQSDVALAKKLTGIYPLPSKEGIHFWEDSLGSDHFQCIPILGIPEKIRSYLGTARVEVSKELNVIPLTGSNSVDIDNLKQKTQAYFQNVVGREIKLDPELVDVNERLETFGIDSIMINQINAQIEKDFGEMPKTLLYENETIGELSDYLMRESRTALSSFFNGMATDSEWKAMESPPQEQEAKLKPLLSNVERDEKVAIIGLHGYYPHSKNLQEYWENLKTGKELIETIPANRWDYAEFYDGDPDKAVKGNIYCKWGSFVDDHDKFDAAFFNISSEESRVMDPQERLFLQSVWSAIEDAGYTRSSLQVQHSKNKGMDVGVFVGVTTNSYQMLVSDELKGESNYTPSSMPWSIANRVSYFFDFQGPSMPVDTACSSSLVAIHLACESLIRKECQVAVAGGVNLYLHPSKYQSFCQKRMVSLDGKCRSFGAGGDGFVPGEGVGSLLLKSLSEAISAGDHIYGVISGSAYEHSGRSNGYSAPNPNAQAAIISRTLQKAGVDARAISYVEGHGTGTQLGDALEMAALKNTFKEYTKDTQFCSVGSLKANMGHSESAAGIAGITKVLYQLKNRQLAPSLNSQEVNPNIEFEGSPFYLQNKLAEWKSSNDLPRRSLINSFGAGGVNASLILEEYIRSKKSLLEQKRGPYVFVLSAKDPLRLVEYVKQILSFLGREKNIDLQRLTYTLQMGREAMSSRLAIVFSNQKELLMKLNDWKKHVKSEGVFEGQLEKDVRNLFTKPKELSASSIQGLMEMARRWCVGEDVAWKTLHQNTFIEKMSLPTYPFAKERHWITEKKHQLPKLRLRSASSRIHPLITFNSSDLNRVNFSSYLSENEFYAQDHRVNNEKVLPGAAFLEMACVAGNIANTKRVSKIKDIVWIHPLSLDKSKVVKTYLSSVGENVHYTISSLNEFYEEIVHAEGQLVFQDEEKATSNNLEPYSISKLKEQCQSITEGAEGYSFFQSNGIEYGSAFKTIEEYGANGSFGISKLKLSESLNSGFGEFILHPSLLDGALQSVIALSGGKVSDNTYLPFAIEEIEILHPLTPCCYAYVEYGEGIFGSTSDVKKFNIKILSEMGTVLTIVKNFSVRAINLTPVLS